MLRKTASEAEKLVGLFGAYGFEVQWRKQENNLIRFSDEFRFVDLWYGRRGFTIGIYYPQTEKMRFLREVGHRQIENELIKIANEELP